MHRAQAEDVKKAQNPFPEKLFYKIGEVSRIAGIEPYVLRYWETEFSFLEPRKNRSGQRVYTRKDLETVLRIKKLLYEEKYTIQGVRQIFGDYRPAKQAAPEISPVEVVEKVKERLRSILSSLS